MPRAARRSSTSRPTVHLAATPGGHLDLLLAVRPAFEDFQRVWVTCRSTSAQALAEEGEEVLVVPRFHGVSVDGLAKARLGIGLAVRERPSLVVTTGSGCLVPFALGARALGASLVYMETMARVTDASGTGKVLGRFADQVIVQWPSMRAAYPQALVCRPAMLDAALDMRGAPRTSGAGTFVAVGTHIEPFDRLLRMVEAAVERGVLPRPAAAQTGECGHRPSALEAEPWMTPDELHARIGAARYVVCHAGSGLIARALKSNLRPIVVPRRSSEGEHVDDHQAQIVERLAGFGLVVPVSGDEITAEHVARVDEPWRPVPGLAAMASLEQALRTTLTTLSRK